MLARVVTRTAQASRIDDVVVATTTATADDVVARLCETRGWTCFRGSETDVLDRYWQAAQTRSARTIVRIASDCPLIDPCVIDEAVALFEQSGADYVTTGDGFPRGLDCEVFSAAALARAWNNATLPHERVHVTPYLFEHPETFRVVTLRSDGNYPDYRWTVDEPSDLEFVRAVYADFGHARFSWRDVLDLVQRRPDIRALNQHVLQKRLADL
jgi:spore coat polysaccharide biosynthesis protein SpsF (cytidylyltransferase family)